jgi:hypothetical protein
VAFEGFDVVKLWIYGGRNEISREKDMTEQEWLASSDLPAMLGFLGSKASDRKFRLFRASCCRRISYLFADQRSQEVINALELYADELIGVMQLKHARVSTREKGLLDRRCWQQPSLGSSG